MHALARISLGTLLLAAAAGGGYLLRGAPAPAPSPPPVAGGITVTTGASPAPVGLRAEEIRAIVREELARRQSPPPAPEPAAPVAPGPEAAEVHDRLDAAIAAGTWTEADRQRLRRLLSSLSQEERQLVLQRLAQAVNDGELHVDTRLL